MKRKPTMFIAYCLLLLTFIGCKKDDDGDTPQNPIDQLPPMTTTGENTIGCLVNGKPFTDSGLMNNFYQLVDGEYYLVINWEEGTTGNFKDGQISIRKTQVTQGESYTLNHDNSTSEDFIGGSANYTYVNDMSSGEFNSNSYYFGTISFIKFDIENHIMSGTFEFQAEEIMTGETVSITDGRFDLTFTQ